MMTFLVTALFLLTIVASFAFGVAAGYWAIRGFLNLFDPARTRSKPASAPALAPTPSGD
jgi:hypothetical protein